MDGWETETVSVQADTPRPVEWSTKTSTEILAAVQAMLEAVADAHPARVVVQASTENADALWRALGLRRTRGGQWCIDGRRYRTKRLAIDSLRDRLARRLVFRGRGSVERVEIKGVVIA